MNNRNRNVFSCVFSYITMMVIMIALGASDSMRGIFSPVFKEHFALDSAGFSLIVTVSYAGNLAFLLFGSRLADKFGLKKVFLCVLLCWLCAVGLYIATDNYFVLLVGMFVTMGTSTLMNTFINLMTPLVFTVSPQLTVNTLFFVQGIGTSGAQVLAGNFAATFSGWKLTNIILLCIGAVGFLLLVGMKVTNPRASSKDNVTADENTAAGDTKVTGEGYSAVLRNKAFLLFVLMFGFYFIAEHGILNWLVLYCTDSLAFSQGEASVYLSLFFGGMTVGRLVFAPVVQKLGTERSLRVFGGGGMLLYVVGLVGAAIVSGLVGGATGVVGASNVAGNSAGTSIFLYVHVAAGLIISIIYPTMVLFIRRFFAESVISTATGTIISVATLFDIGFNLVFGKLVDNVGFTYSILILPVSMVVFYLLFYRLYKNFQRG